MSSRWVKLPWADALGQLTSTIIIDLQPWSHNILLYIFFLYYIVFQDLDLGIKWPNDIYAKNTKIGGIIVNSHVQSTVVVCNVGVGLNLSNSSPTLCINDLINEYNIKNGTALPSFTLEKSLALMFNEIERLINIVQAGDVQYLLDLYYKHWLHR